ncbi:hypothetical protein [Campylobacter sputorum]|uniref:hypothetical protein n=1 Tax=Campylobacter sputorum TaxID=206 RepID=UPI00053C0335|nr:hypothetical protein [Campylobacter sputorum]
MKDFRYRLPVNISIKNAIKFEKLCETYDKTISIMAEKLINDFYSKDEKVKSFLKGFNYENTCKNS